MVAKGLRKHPFEFFAAFIVFIIGLYGVLDPDWPPQQLNTWEYAVLSIEAWYFLVSGLVVVASFFARPKWPAASIAAQMFGWLFIGFAGIMAIIIKFIISNSEFIQGDTDIYRSIATLLVWIVLIVAAFARFIDIRQWYKAGGR